MPGRNRKNRAPNRNDFRNTQSHDQAPQNRPRPPRPSGPSSEDGPRRRSHVQTHVPSSGIHRANDNSNPGLSSRLRNLKQQSDIVKRELADLISQIDDLQPDAAAMDWAGSAGTIVYVPIACARDGSFQHAQIRSISDEQYPSAAASFHFSESIQARTRIVDRPDTPITFMPYAESLGDRTGNDTLVPPNSSSSTAVQDEGSFANIAISDRATTSTVRDSAIRPTAVQDDVIPCGMPSLSRDILKSMPRQTGRSNWHRKQEISMYTTPEMSYRDGGWLGDSRSNSTFGGQRTNQARATDTSLPTPPPSPVGEHHQARYEGLGM